jgi:hypothetical protein
LNKKILSLLLLTIPATIIDGGTGHLAGLSVLQRQAHQTLRGLVVNHPKMEVRIELNAWIANKKVFLSYQSDQMPPEMGAEIVRINGKYEIVLVVNPSFLVREWSINKLEDLRYKQLVLFHEYTHIANHISGKAMMEARGFRKETAPQRAKNMWDSEWLAVEAEWRFAKEIGATRLMPSIYRETQKYGEQIGFLEGFYKSLANSVSSSNGLEYLRPTWRTIYEQKRSAVGK